MFDARARRPARHPRQRNSREHVLQSPVHQPDRARVHAPRLPRGLRGRPRRPPTRRCGGPERQGPCARRQPSRRRQREGDPADHRRRGLLALHLPARDGCGLPRVPGGEQHERRPPLAIPRRVRERDPANQVRAVANEIAVVNVERAESSLLVVVEGTVVTVTGSDPDEPGSIVIPRPAAPSRAAPPRTAADLRTSLRRPVAITARYATHDSSLARAERSNSSRPLGGRCGQPFRGRRFSGRRMTASSAGKLIDSWPSSQCTRKRS
jgi:hypothetical protein